MMNYTFCTLFDRNYLYKGLALYESLSAHCSAFTLWVLCMDEITYSFLKKMELQNVQLIPLEEFEDEQLRQLKQERTVAEYCWTCTAPLILYVMGQEPQAAMVAYLDADLFFFSDPRPIYDEMSDQSILIIEHRYAPQYKDWEDTSGIYNVSMVVFRADFTGLACLNWWREKCLQACFLNPEQGQCGDQKYLDDWPARFEKVVVLQHKGGGLAPWNISNYQLRRNNGRTFVDSDELIFYHFHSLQITERSILSRRSFIPARGYKFTGRQLEIVYRPYVRELQKTIDRVGKITPDFPWGYVSLGWLELLRAFRAGNLLFA